MASNTNRKRIGSELGQSGTYIFDGFISGEEYNLELTGLQALRIWDEMRRSDASVAAALKAVKLPVKGVEWLVEPASDDPRDIEIADFARHVIFDILRWKKTLGEIMTYLDFGFSVFEEVFDYAVVDGKDRIVLSKLAFRKQRSILKWQADGKPGVTQLTMTGQSVPIPARDIVVFTNEQEGDNYEGVSLLRPAYKHWFIKDKLYQIDAVGHERQALGVVDIAYPIGAKDADIKKAENLARNVRANEEGFISHFKDWDVGFMNMGAQSLKDTEPSINHHDRQISKSVLVQFIDLGATSGSGSRAVGEPQMKLFEQAVQAITTSIADTFNDNVMKDLIDMNFNVTDYPKLKAGQINKDKIVELAESIAKLVVAGFINPTKEDEVYIRGIMGLPEITEEDDEATEDEVDENITDEDLEDHGIENIPKTAAVVSIAKKASAKLRRLLYGKSDRAA